jgi:hypothetical protein
MSLPTHSAWPIEPARKLSKSGGPSDVGVHGIVKVISKRLGDVGVDNLRGLFLGAREGGRLIVYGSTTLYSSPATSLTSYPLYLPASSMHK